MKREHAVLVVEDNRDDVLFIRRALQASLERTLARFGHERRAELARAPLD